MIKKKKTQQKRNRTSHSKKRTYWRKTITNIVFDGEN